MSAATDFQRLASDTWVRRVDHYEEVDSTQDRAREAGARIPLSESLLVVADRQTAGRGRGTNRWWTGEGNLAFSLLFDPTAFGLPQQPMPQLSLAAATALIDAVPPLLNGHQLGLHWPNDLYVGGRKLAGILVDVLGDSRHLLGVGINTNCSPDTAPAELRDSVSTLANLTGRVVDHSQLLESFLKRLAETLRMLAESPETIGRRFNDFCLQHGQLLTVRSGEHAVSGRCAGIAADGALLLDLPSGRRAIYSGTLR